MGNSHILQGFARFAFVSPMVANSNGVELIKQTGPAFFFVVVVGTRQMTVRGCRNSSYS